MAGIASFRSGQFLKRLLGVTPSLKLGRRVSPPLVHVPVNVIRVRCAATNPGNGGGKVSSRLAEMQKILQEAEERSLSAGSEPAPKITLDHVTVGFARSGGPGGQNVNKGRRMRKLDQQLGG